MTSQAEHPEARPGTALRSRAVSLSEGSLWLATDIPPLTAGRTPLLALGRHWSEPAGVLGLWVDPRGAPVLRHRTASGAVGWLGPAAFCGAGDRLRVSLQVWQSLGRLLLDLENGTTGAQIQARLSCAGNLPLHAAQASAPLHAAPVPLTARGCNAFDPDTLLPTARGPRRADTLVPGEVLVTRSGPRVLRQIHAEPLTDLQRQEAIRFEPPWFGLDQPLVIHPDQRIRLDAPEVQALTGRHALLLAASDMQLPGAVQPDWTGTGAMICLGIDESALLRFGELDIALQGTGAPDAQGAPLPPPAAVAWAGRTEARAIVDAMARSVRFQPSATRASFSRSRQS